ncbi:MAG: hypothetical protein JWO82_3285 [Akkermansiaceae bacterium]|nr:hypothetical protein [Akkermansiaceae bacterium]
MKLPIFFRIAGGAVALAVGLAAGSGYRALSRAEGNDEASRTSQNTGRVEGTGAAEAAARARQAKESAAVRERLALLARDPYVAMDDAEIERMAAGLDLRRLETVAILNAVLSTDLRTKLWLAVFRRDADKLPVARLLETLHEARGMPIALIGVVIASIERREPDFFKTPAGASFLWSRLACAPRDTSSLKADLASLPKATQGMRDYASQLAKDWAGNGENGEGLRQIREAAQEGMVFNWAMVGAQIRNPNEGVVAELAQIPGPLRNRLLRDLAGSGQGPEPEGLASLLGGMDSLVVQHQTAENWLRKPGRDRDKLIEALEKEDEKSGAVGRLVERLRGK